MKTETILKAIEALNKARTALNCGNLSIHEQIRLGGDCSDAAFDLRRELLKELPAVALKEAA